MEAFDSLSDLLRLVVTLFLVWAAAWIDFRTTRIPNALILAGAALGLLMALESGGWAGLISAVSGLFLGLALMLPGYLLLSTGAGDVKLMAAAGALLGPQFTLIAFLIAILSGAVLGLVLALIASIRGAEAPFRRYATMARTLIRSRRLVYLRPSSDEAMGQRFAFAPAIAVGVTVAVLWPFVR